MYELFLSCGISACYMVDSKNFCLNYSTSLNFGNINTLVKGYIEGGRHVSQVQVDIVQLQLRQRFSKRSLNIRRTIVSAPQLKVKTIYK